jgi:hypothetical protein
MSCLLTKGRLKGCKNGMGGVKRVWFVNDSQLTLDRLTVNGLNSNIITDVSVDPTPINAYQYDLRANAGLNQTANVSKENGTTFFGQELTLTLHDINAQSNNEFKLLAYGTYKVIVELNTGVYMLIGLTRGADMTEGSIASGTAEGDLNGYTMKFMANEYEPAYFLDDAPSNIGFNVIVGD